MRQTANELDAVVTGLGVVSAFGLEIERYVQALAASQVAFVPTPWMPEDSGLWHAPVSEFAPSDWLSEQVIDGTDPFAQYALVGTIQALAMAGLRDLDSLRTGVVLGTSMGGVMSLQRSQHLLEVGGAAAVPRKTQIQVWPNMAAAQIAMQYDIHGPSITVATACASSVDAVGTAMRFINAGMADVIITGASEGTGSAEFMPALSANQISYGMAVKNDDPTKVCRPFDRDRTGIGGGEGAGILILESRAHALARGAKILGVLRGYASLADGYHPSSPEPSGKWEALVMQRALDSANLPEGVEIDAVYAHGTGTKAGDTAEIRAINSVWKHRGMDLLVTSTKGHFGHPGGSAAALNMVAGITAMHQDRVLPTASTTEVDPEAKFTVVLGAPAVRSVETLQFNAFGFGGQNASLVVTRN